jgi:ribosomal-protein-alanine N-acetyltransferase
MMSAIEIAGARTEDAAMLSEIHGRCLSPAWNVETFNTFLGRSTGLGMLATTVPDAQPVGFCLGRLADDEAEVLSVAVLSDWHRQGVGDRLMQALHARLQSDGGKSVFLEVAHDNVAAIGFYRALGYVEVARRRGYYAATVGTPARDALVMRLQFAELAIFGPDAMLKRKL